jgi:hypothetical protein
VFIELFHAGIVLGARIKAGSRTNIVTLKRVQKVPENPE